METYLGQAVLINQVVNVEKCQYQLKNNEEFHFMSYLFLLVFLYILLSVGFSVLEFKSNLSLNCSFTYDLLVFQIFTMQSNFKIQNYLDKQKISM